MILMIVTTFYIIYYAGNRPHFEKERAYIETFNEAMIMVMNYHMVSFSNFNVSHESQFTMGYSFVASVVFVIAANLASVGIALYNKAK